MCCAHHYHFNARHFKLKENIVENRIYFCWLLKQVLCSILPWHFWSQFISVYSGKKLCAPVLAAFICADGESERERERLLLCDKCHGMEPKAIRNANKKCKTTRASIEMSKAQIFLLLWMFSLMSSAVKSTVGLDIYNANTKATFDLAQNLIIFTSTNSYRNLCIEVVTINNSFSLNGYKCDAIKIQSIRVWVFFNAQNYGTFSTHLVRLWFPCKMAKNSI